MDPTPVKRASLLKEEQLKKVRVTDTSEVVKREFKRVINGLSCLLEEDKGEQEVGGK